MKFKENYVPVAIIKRANFVSAVCFQVSQTITSTHRPQLRNKIVSERQNSYHGYELHKKRKKKVVKKENKPICKLTVLCEVDS